jgi:peroxiredoxin
MRARARWAILAALVAIIAVLSIVRLTRPQLFMGSVATTCPADARRANLDFRLKNTDGQEVRLADYKDKVLLLDFWATWCGPCKVEIPAFVQLYETYKPRGFEVLGVVVMDEFPRAKPFAEQYKMTYPILDGVNREDVETAFGPFLGLPTTFLIARDGRICAKHLGLPPVKFSFPSVSSVKDAFEAEIRSLL